MIPVREQPEPTSFEVAVRQPGQAFLRATPNPTKGQWKKARYWQNAIDDLYGAYDGICAYSAEWIPPSTGEASVDHFIPKSANPRLAYEWPNYRLSARRFNLYKQDTADVIDPFTLQADWFVLDFPSLQVKANSTLNPDDTDLVWRTIDRLRLNDERSIKSRQRWVRDFCEGHFAFDYLMKNAPFIAYELLRQGLRDAIVSIYRT